MRRRGPNRAANIWTARVIPLILLGIISYSSWVLTKLVCVDYLINPSPTIPAHPRVGAAIAILVIYYILLIFLLACFCRLIYTISVNPGYVPRGPQWRKTRTAESRRGRKRRRHETVNAEKLQAHEYLPADPSYDNRDGSYDQEAGPQEFWRRDVFVCNYDGRPNFCSTCLAFKPDRAHHCSEVDRCVRKMDHFCPWVGGIVSETSFKFFIQFNFYSACLTLTVLVVMAYLYAERRVKENFLDVHWILVLSFASLFLLFTSTMSMSSFQLALINTTTVDNLSRRFKIYYMAVYVPRPADVLLAREKVGMSELRTITYPRPPEEMVTIMQQQSQSGDAAVASATNATEQPASNKPRPDVARQVSSTRTEESRTFAIIELPKGANPWDLGYVRNAQEVMGYNFFDWVLPIRYSPCTRYEDPRSLFKLGMKMPDFSDPNKLEEIVDGKWPPAKQHERRRRRRRRRTHSSAGSGAEESGQKRSRRQSSSRRKIQVEDVEAHC